MTAKRPTCTDTDEPGLIPLDDAVTRMLSSVPVVGGYERVAIENARGRTLAETITAGFNVPGHTNSAVDGYALYSADIPAKGKAVLAIAGKAFAGQTFDGVIQPGHCVRIMTGARMPEGLDTVIMQEHAEILNNAIRIDSRHKAGENVREAGEDIRQGQTVLHPGKFLTPPDIGLIASLGIGEINVGSQLRIAIASTGNEICSIGAVPGPGRVFDSNRYSLLAALNRPDVELINLGIIEDTPQALLQAFEKAGQYADVIISTGGVSVGERDFTKTALQTLGRIDFWKIAIKPGRHLAFGQIGDAVFFGLPGNPVAVLVAFYLLTLPVIEKMLGISNKPIAPVIPARMLEDLRKKPGRTEVPRGIIELDDNGQWTVRTTGNQGSGILSSMCLANSFIILEHDRSGVKAGELVWVKPFAGLF